MYDFCVFYKKKTSYLAWTLVLFKAVGYESRKMLNENGL